MKLTIFGPNLCDQSKGQFVVHAAGCADCKKFSREYCSTADYETQESVVRDIFSDIIAEGTNPDDVSHEVWFAPCVKLPLKD